MKQAVNRYLLHCWNESLAKIVWDDLTTLGRWLLFPLCVVMAYVFVSMLLLFLVPGVMCHKAFGRLFTLPIFKRIKAVFFKS